MRKISRLIAGAASVAAAAALVAGTVTTASAAPNDPPKGVTPAPYDIVGGGSDTTTFIMDAIAGQYDKAVGSKHSVADPYLYSWNATPPGSTSSAPVDITPKAGCSAKTVRPNGSSAGISALDSNQTTKFKGVTYPCFDFARSSGGRKPANPKKAPGGIVFVAFARDAITWSVRTAAHGGSDAPKSLTPKQLQGIFTCKITNWKTVGGKSGAIKVYLPQSGSGTLSTWEKFMGITGALPGCVTSKPEENEGQFAAFNSPNVIYIYSIGAYVAQQYHSPLPGHAPTAGQNAFGTNVTGFLGLGEISGVNPLSAGKVPTINPAFPTAFWRTIYNVVRYTSGTPDNMSKKLEAIFGAKAEKGYICSNAAAQTTIVDYGFVPYKLCGSTS